MGDALLRAGVAKAGAWVQGWVIVAEVADPDGGPDQVVWIPDHGTDDAMQADLMRRAQERMESR